MRTLSVISFFSLLLLTACFGGQREALKEVTVNNQYSIQIPQSMERTNELHDFAQLQFADEERGYFLIGIEEDKQELRKLQLFYGLDDYAHFVTRTVADGLDTVNVVMQNEQTVNGFACVSTDLFGALTSGAEPVEVFYRLMVLESSSHFYQLITWTSREQYPLFRPIANSIECSFAELEPSQAEGPASEPELLQGAGSAAETAN